MLKDLLYFIPKEYHSEENLKKLLTTHSEIKFVSLVGIDLSGHDTDEKIPMKIFLEDISGFLRGAVQTDGSSVGFPGIANINNAKIDMVPDLESNWFVDYNYEHLDSDTQKPTGTLRIPCFLYHENKAVDSRHILKNSIEHFKTAILDLFKKYPQSLAPFKIQYEDIADIVATSATELEFWVKTPNDKAEVEELSTSQVLQEQYWKSTTGAVRTALEQSLLMLEAYGLEPEMGHKEVGGVRARIDESGKLTHIMEQLEIDWKYADALQAADNELLARTLIREVFRSNGIDVTFLAKPIEGVAGSGEHTHIGVALKLKNGKRINLFTAPDIEKDYLSTIGYSSIMGVLKNYEVINPFVSSSNDSLRRLKPGFEAPVCIVTSLGHSVAMPSRNRTILLALIRDLQSPLATRFELRAPNPHTNTYLALATIYLSMLDGITYAIENGKSESELLQELSKKPGEEASYLEKDRAYRSEEDVFEDFTDAEREAYFGKAPATVYENFSAFDKYPEKLAVLKQGEVFNDKIIGSYRIAKTKKWLTEISNRILANYSDDIRTYTMLHTPETASDLDYTAWSSIHTLRQYLMKDTSSVKSLFSRIKDAIDRESFDEVSILQIELDGKMKELRELYLDYKKNILDI